MPIYEYKCKNCNDCFEKIVFSEDSKSVKCPKCGSKNIIRLISSTNIGSRSNAVKCGSGVSRGFS